MKNTSSIKKAFLLTLLLTTSVFLGILSTSSAEVTPVYTFGRPQVVSMDLYATEHRDNGDYYVTDASTSTGYAYNQIDFYLGSWKNRSIGFSVKPNSATSGLDWTLDKSSWSLVLLDSPILIYESSVLDNYFVPGYQSLKCSFKPTKAGTQNIRVTSPGILGDGSDSVAYTMTLIVIDNGPAPEVASGSTIKQ